MSKPRPLQALPPKANLRPAEIAAFLDFDLDTVYEMIHAGKIPAIKFTRHYLIPRDKFLAAFEAHAFQPDF